MQNSPKKSKHQKWLDGKMKQWARKDVDTYIYEKNEDVILNSIVVKKEKRKQGLGTQIMTELCEYADKQNVRLLLSPDKSLGGTSTTRLKKFYRSFGFKPNKGRNKDFRVSETMIRPRKN